MTLTVVLDIDGTLVSAEEAPVPTSGPQPDFADPAVPCRIHGWFRPHAREFVAELLCLGVHIGVFTHGTPEYAALIVEAFGLTGRTLFVYAGAPQRRVRTGARGETEICVAKRLTRVFRAHRRLGVGPRNCLIVDDTWATMTRNHGNGILIPRWVHGDEGAADDTALLDVLSVVRRAIDCPNVRAICKCEGAVKCAVLVPEHHEDEDKDERK